MKKTSVVIVNYNTCEILKDCIENLLSFGFSQEEFEIIVVDNASTDGSAKMVKEEFSKKPQVICIETGNNGLSAGHNIALKQATGEYILYLGSDAFPKKETITGMVTYFEENSKVGTATCKLVLRNGKPDMDAHRGFPTPWAAFTHFSKLNRIFPKSRIFNQYFLGWEDLNEPHEIDMCISHFMLVRKKVHEQVGVWDEDYFLYGEDVDFCYRVKEAGWKIMYLPQWEALHYKGVSVGIRKESSDISKASEETKTRIKKSTTEAMKLFYEKHYSEKYPKFCTNMVLFGIDVLAKLRAKY